MTFMLAAMEQSDIAECADVDEAAMKDWPYAQAHHQPPFSRKDLFRYWVSKEWGQNQNHHWMKVTDSDTGEMAAVAWWQFESRDSDSHNTDDEDEQKETVGSSEPGNIDPKFPKIWIQTGRRWRTFRNEFIGEQAHAVLSLLITRPQYQRRGAGGMLVKWGCEKADELNMISAVYASEAGLKVYTKHGFEVVETSEFDLRPYGVDATELRRGMIRRPRSEVHAC